MRRVLSLVGAVLLVVLGVVAGVALAGRIGAGTATDNETVDKPELGTVEVRRTDLVTRKTFDAALGFVGARTVIGQLAGTVTGTPEEGIVLEVGQAVIEIDGYPVLLMKGTRPMWRPIADGIDPGPDVRQLEEQLAALGLLEDADGEVLDPDDEFDSDTAAAVERWREQVGLAEGDGVELGRIVFVDGPVRVGAVLVELGETVISGRPWMEVSTARQAVFLDLPVDDRDLAAVGEQVIVVLPGDVRTTGVVAEIGRVVKSIPGPGQTEEVVEVAIELDDPALAGDLDRAPVEVELVSERAEDVLAVPVNALVALAEGGYALQLVEGETRRLVPVEIGTFVDTLVEVEGPVSEGDLVAVPR